MSEVFETAIVEKRNVLNELRTTLHTTQELRLFSIYLSRINPYDTNTRVVRFPLSDFQRIMNFGKLNIAQLKASASGVLKSQVFIPKENGGFKGINLFDTFEVDQDKSGGWYVEINASNAALPLMFDFKNRYFRYELWNALRLKAPSQIRMYEILKQYEKLGKREIEVKKLQELLGVNYTRWDRFKAKVLDSCQKALKETTDICYTYERGKTGTGGKWLTIIFHISKNKDYVDQLTLWEFMPQEQAAESSGAAQETQLELFDTDTEQNENTAFFSGACDDEFTAAEIESLVTIVNTMELPPHEMGAVFAKYHFLLEQYTRFKAIAERTNIKNRYSYFYTMIQSERDKQRAGDTK